MSSRGLDPLNCQPRMRIPTNVATAAHAATISATCEMTGSHTIHEPPEAPLALSLLAHVRTSLLPLRLVSREHDDEGGVQGGN